MIRLDMENLAGIASGTINLHPGQNTVAADNWRGKSSLIKAIQTAIGTETALSANATAGGLTLHTPEQMVELSLERQLSHVERAGRPLLEAEDARSKAALFCGLDGQNRIREAIRAHEPLHSLLGTPLDLEDIDGQIQATRKHKAEVEDRLAQATQAQAALADIELHLDVIRQTAATLTQHASPAPVASPSRCTETRGTDGDRPTDDATMASSPTLAPNASGASRSATPSAQSHTSNAANPSTAAPDRHGSPPSQGATERRAPTEHHAPLEYRAPRSRDIPPASHAPATDHTSPDGRSTTHSPVVPASGSSTPPKISPAAESLLPSRSPTPPGSPTTIPPSDPPTRRSLTAKHAPTPSQRPRWSSRPDSHESTRSRPPTAAPNATDSGRAEIAEMLVESAHLRETLHTLDATLQEFRANRNKTRAELDALGPTSRDSLEETLRSRRDAYAEIQTRITHLHETLSLLERGRETGRFDRLLGTDTSRCWVCGTAQPDAAVATRIDHLHSDVETCLAESEDIREAFRHVAEQRATLAARRHSERQLQTELDGIEDAIRAYRHRRTQVRETLAGIETDLDAVRERHRAHRDAEHRRITRLVRLDRTAAALRERRADLQECAHSLDAIESDLEELTTTLACLTSRRDRVLEEIRTAFESGLSDLTTRLSPTFDTVTLTPDFQLRILRDGARLTPEALSESELELVGIMVCVAGYLAYDVQDICPIILLDSVGMLTAHTLRALCAYLVTQTDYLVTTAYPSQHALPGHTIDIESCELRVS